MTTPFISRADLSDYMAQDLSASDVAGIAISAACEAIRSFTHRQLNYVEDDVITLDGTGTRALLLPEWPVIGTPTVEENDVATTDFVVQNSRLVRSDFGVWSLGVSNISVTYSHGYATEEGDVVPGTGPLRTPDDIRMVALELAAGLMSVSETRFHTVSPRDSVGGSQPIEGPGPAILTAEQRQQLVLHRDKQMV